MLPPMLLSRCASPRVNNTTNKVDHLSCELWLTKIVDWTTEQMSTADSGHGIDHVRRVVANATTIALKENANPQIVLPAAWLHDCVFVPKNSSQRNKASRLAADKASQFLNSIGYPAEYVQPVHHCIMAHSFSAKIDCQTIEAKVVQDADRLEALGAIGISRCLMTGGAMGQRLYHPDDPFPVDREPEDTVQSIDHFFVKLLKLPMTMKTSTGRELASQRSGFMIEFLSQLCDEIKVDRDLLLKAIDKACQE